MAVERTNRDVRTLIGQIAAGEIKLPEIQRGYVWKASQVARLIESLYRGYPAGSLLFWKTGHVAETREAAIGSPQALASVIPLYLLDGQQRLTSLFRVLTDHPEAQVVFNIETEVFQNQSAATRRNKKWIKIHDVVGPDADVFTVHSDLKAAGLAISDIEIGRRLSALQKITQRDFHMEVLHDFEYEEVAEIFVRVNSGGRALKTTDLALATLSARAPGFLGQLEAESARWTEHGYGALDVNFLIKALTLNLSISGKRLSSVAKLTTANAESVEEGWAKVRRGLSRVVPMLQEKLLIPTTSLIPSLAALHPLIVYYGRQSEGGQTPEAIEKGLLYWFMAATARNRYGGATDTALTQDIKALDSETPVKDLLSNLGIGKNGISVAASDLAGRSHQSPYLMFSYLAAAHAGAMDWWDGEPISASVDGSGKPQYSLVHPSVTLRSHRDKFSSAEINELANIVFVSQQAAKNMIGSRSPAAYVQDIADADLIAHAIPDDPALLETEGYRGFLSARRELLADRITALLDWFKPDFLGGGGLQTGGQENRSLVLRGYTGGGRSVLVAIAELPDQHWIGWIARDEFAAALDAASAGLASDVSVGGEAAAMRVDDEGIVTFAGGPFLIRGSLGQWRSTVKEAFEDAQPLDECPEPSDEQWLSETSEFLLSDAGAAMKAR
ncbi:GmrSD restriction endonuclease domain-containing protein [Streptomyces pristinaespiralis]|uniref:GmrSD restriction endonuclease domain-containing protein n=1 Tax=Streptomyces pristinaespiralis TaxID=38300 RepID=UPI00340F9E55